MGKDAMVPKTSGVDVKLLGMVDLGPELDGMAGHQLRMRMVTIAPGGVFGPVTITSADQAWSTSCKD